MDRAMVLTSLPAASLVFFALTSGWSMLLSSQPPTMTVLEGFTGKDDYTSYNRHEAYVNGFPVYLELCGMPKDFAAEFADPIRNLVGCMDLAIVFGIFFAQRPDQRTIEALVDSMILPMESMLVQIMAGVLILFGLRYNVILEEKWPESGEDVQDISNESKGSAKKTL